MRNNILNSLFALTTLVLLLGCCQMLLAQSLNAQSLHRGNVKNKKAVRLIGRREVTVVSSKLRMADLALVSTTEPSEEEAVIFIKNIVVDTSPQPGREKNVAASRLLEKLQEAGVALETIGYMFPKVMKVRRAYRELRAEEILAVIENYLNSPEGKSVEITVKRVIYNKPVMVSPLSLEMKVAAIRAIKTGRKRFTMLATFENGELMRFTVDVLVDEWRNVPVARRALPRGSVVSSNDVMMARLNVKSIPRDAASNAGGIIGYEIKQGINYGAVFQNSKLAIPPVISSGSKVTLLYKTKYLRATASGLAIEDGLKGERIKIRNEASKKIIMGTVIETGLVEVHP